ncbi:MAG TPA: hypothetical protein VKS03_05345 [Thermoanaerobaculia bacterium]|nr:hypothetical protein [Thermoanaerobaculia bacterium]
MQRSTRIGLAVILVSFFLPMIAIMFAEKVGDSFIIPMGSIEQRGTFEQFPIGRDYRKEPDVIFVEAAGATLLLDKDLPKDEANRISREFVRLRGRDAQAKGEVYVFRGWVDEVRHGLPYRYVVAGALTLLLAGLLSILLGGSQEPVPEKRSSTAAPKGDESRDA